MLLGLFALIGWGQVRVGRVGVSRPELALLFCDPALLTFIAVVPNPFQLRALAGGDLRHAVRRKGRRQQRAALCAGYGRRGGNGKRQAGAPARHVVTKSR